MPSRWWTYQRERFPLAVNGPLILVLAVSSVAHSATLRGSTRLADLPALAAACVVAFVFFFQLRVADEFKDAADDARFRAYRPVPRGLVTLRELAWLGGAGVVLQVAAILLVDPALLLGLAAVGAFYGLMTVEFFAPSWLKRRPLLYLVSHMLVMPLLLLLLTAFDWHPQGAVPPASLGWFLAFGFAAGVTAEVGRKIRAPMDEEPGVDTYSVVWGRGRAVAFWIAAAVAAAALACASGDAAHIGAIVIPTAIAAVLVAMAAGMLFLKNPTSGRARSIEWTSGILALVLYLELGPGPFLWGLR